MKTITQLSFDEKSSNINRRILIFTVIYNYYFIYINNNETSQTKQKKYKIFLYKILLITILLLQTLIKEQFIYAS